MKKLSLRKQTVAALAGEGLRRAGGGYEFDFAIRRFPTSACFPGGPGTLTGINPTQGPGCEEGGGYGGDGF